MNRHLLVSPGAAILAAEGCCGRRNRRWRRAGGWLAMVSLMLSSVAGCTTSPASPDTVIEPIQIDRVDVTVGSGVPPTVEVRAQGVVGDGCSVVRTVRQERAANAVTVTILRERPKDAVCTQQALLYDARIPLDGAFPPGAYIVRVNAVERAFSVP